MSSVKHLSFACKKYYFCCALIFSFVKVDQEETSSVFSRFNQLTDSDFHDGMFMFSI